MLELPIAEAPAVYHGKAIGAIAGVFPWARSILHNCAYIQLDVTLRAIRSFGLCTPLAIVINESLSIGL
jgi:hypothetical protein